MDRLLSLKTMQVRQINVRSFINWCELEYQGKIQARYLNSGFPPAMTSKDIRRKGTRRAGFTHDELHALFSDRAGYLKATEGIVKMNNINNKISNNNISSLEIKTLHTQVILFHSEDNDHTCICSATLETCDGRTFTDIDESPHHLPAGSADQLITLAADRAKSRVLFTASHIPTIPCRPDAIDTTCSQIDSTGADNLPSSEHRILPQVIDKNTLKGGGNKPITERPKSLIESKSKKKGLSGNESSQKIINKKIDELTGAEEDLVIKSTL